MPRAHLEPRKGTVDQAVEYCKKEGDFEEFGIKPMSQTEKGAANKRRYEEALQMAKEGRFDDIPGDLLTRHYTTYKRSEPTIYQNRKLSTKRFRQVTYI